MHRKFFHRASVLFPIFLFVFLLAGCFATYSAPDKETVRKAMFGGDWPADLPAPAFIEKLTMRGSMSFSPEEATDATFYFENVKKEEVKAYVDALKNKGFDVQGVSFSFSTGSNSDRLIDEYEATKNRYTLKVSAFGRRPDGAIVISLRGLTTDEFKALNCPTLADEEAQLLPDQNLEKRYTEDITAVLLGSPQQSIVDDGGKWIERIPVPDFIQNLDLVEEKPQLYDSADSVSLKFKDISITALENYLVTLAANGFTIYNTASYQGYENIDPNGILALMEVESITPAKNFVRSWPGGFVSAVKGSLTIDITGIGEPSNTRIAFAGLLTNPTYQRQMENYGQTGQSGELPGTIDASIVLRGLSQAEVDKLMGSSLP